jgi:hypothetical protein
MCPPTAVTVDDDLPSRQTGVAEWAADDESARGVEVVDRPLVDELLREHRIDDVLLELDAEGVEGDVLAVHRRDEDRVDADGLHGAAALLVFDCCSIATVMLHVLPSKQGFRS